MLLTGAAALAVLWGLAGEATSSSDGTTVRAPDPIIEPVTDGDRQVLQVPAGLVRPTVIIALHGYTGNAKQLQKGLRSDAWARELDATVVYPQGLGARSSWNAGGCCGSAARSGIDDVAYVSRLIGSLRERGAQRFVLVGYSNGGMLAYRVACERPDLVHEVAVVNATITVPRCEGAFSALHLAGELDHAVPIQGVDNVPYLFTGFRPLAELPNIAPNARIDVSVLPGVGHEISPLAHDLITDWIAGRG